MRRFHNPRFAPESLERKLSPTGIVPVPVAAQVYVPIAQATQATQATQADDSNLDTSTLANDSSLDTSTHADDSSSDSSTPSDTTTTGDPGDPPVGTPSIPVGPIQPA